MGEVLRDADARLDEVRQAGHPRAGGLVIASDQTHARAIADRLGQVCGESPEIVMSDEPEASARIAAFAASDQRWLVSVLMVSEGVDIPRLRVGVYATAARTELFFRQVVGRFVRRTPGAGKQMSYLLLPADSKLKRLAGQIEEERRHALDLMPSEAPEEEAEERADRAPVGERFEALSSGAAQLDAPILSETTLQLFATEEPAPPPALAAFQARAAEASFESRERLRERRKALAAQVSRRTGEPHSHVNARINRATGAATVTAATVKQLVKGNDLLLAELRGP
jgi:superfamily II DNA or RNA helicase